MPAPPKAPGPRAELASARTQIDQYAHDLPRYCEHISPVAPDSQRIARVPIMGQSQATWSAHLPRCEFVAFSGAPGAVALRRGAATETDPLPGLGSKTLGYFWLDAATPRTREHEMVADPETPPEPYERHGPFPPWLYI